MAPIVRVLSASERFDPIVITTGQHAGMVAEIHSTFGVATNVDLGLQVDGLALGSFAAGAMEAIGAALRHAEPDVVVVQGDTTSALMGGLAAAYERIPVAHVEAGLRTGDRLSPFPEELNRLLLGQAAQLHFAATEQARQNLLREGIADDAIVCTGNTVIDALFAARDNPVPYTSAALRGLAQDGFVLVTAHRRESWGSAMQSIGRAVARLARLHPALTFVVPAHPNPIVRDSLLPPLKGIASVRICEPLDYRDLTRALGECRLVLTDSGGIQEEAPALGTPVLVLRDETEREEAVTLGLAQLVGTDEERVVAAAVSLLANDLLLRRMRANPVSPYGDGRASERIVTALAGLVGASRGGVSDHDHA